MASPLISVILPTYNRADMLRGALESICQQETAGEFCYEVIVVDNASTDATKSIIQQVAAQSPVPLRYFYHSEPGPAPARNCGLKQSQGEWLAFFDDDELANADWLHHLYCAALKTGAPIIGGAVQLDVTPETRARLNHFVRTTSLREIDYYSTIQRYTNKRLPGTNNALVARQVFQTIGDFNVAIVGGGSDSDFFLRALQAGMDLYYSPQAIVKHRVAPNRLTVDYFRWDAHQGCAAFAGLDFKYKGRSALSLHCGARIGHAIFVVMPLLAWAWIKTDQAEILGQKVRLWRAEGYARKTLALLAPACFPQTSFFADLEFRRGRIVGQTAAQLETAA
jgi:glycosyltransferase involved in cell wall biosynthesis